LSTKFSGVHGLHMHVGWSWRCTCCTCWTRRGSLLGTAK
jgi:hypothetical protein